ncbi:MAG: ferredoxin [Cellulomonas sp.]
MTARDVRPSAARARPATEVRLRVDPVACDGIGLCAHLAAGVVELDRWGYPVVSSEPLRRGDLGDARSAVRACPRRALWIETVQLRAVM